MAEFTHQRVAALDGVRGIAILLVLSFHWIFASLPGWHSPELTPTYNFVRHLTMLNWAGVDLFFVLSGFLIGGIVLDNRGAANFFRVFYVRRACRIMPLYVLLLALFAAGFILLPWREAEPLRHVFDDPMPAWAYLLFLQNMFPTAAGHVFGNFGLGNTWSLAVEEQFYLVLPAAMALLPWRATPAIALTGIVAAIALRTALWLVLPHELASDIAYSFLPCRMDALLIGVLAAWAVRDPYWSRWLGTRLRLVRASVGALALAFAGFILRRWSAGDMPMITLGFTGVALACGGFILIAYYDPPAVLHYTALRSFGAGAYSIYLFHRPLGMIVHWAVLGRDQSVTDVAGIAVTGLCLCLVAALAALSYRFLERPLIRLGHKAIYTMPNRPILHHRRQGAARQ